MTFEFGHLLDPIGHQQVHGEARSAPADAASPAPVGSATTARLTDEWDDQNGLDADAWLFDLLTESAPPADPVAEEPPAAPPAAPELPRPAPGTLIAGLPAPTGSPEPAPVPGPESHPEPVAAAPVVHPAVGVPEVAASSAVASTEPSVPDGVTGAGASANGRSRFAEAAVDDDRLPVRRRRH